MQIPLSACRPRLYRIGQDTDIPVGVAEAHILKLTVPSPPAPWPCDYALALDGCPGFAWQNRWTPSGTGLDDLTLGSDTKRQSIGPTPDTPLHFCIQDGMVEFYPDSTLV